MATKFRAWDDYYIPGTTVLRNKFNETDAATLSAKEEFAASARLDQLADAPVEGRFDYDHMKAIHRHIFQDIYEWAGQERVGPLSGMTKDGPDVVNFAPGDPAAPVVATVTTRRRGSLMRRMSSTGCSLVRIIWSVYLEHSSSSGWLSIGGS